MEAIHGRKKKKQFRASFFFFSLCYVINFEK